MNNPGKHVLGSLATALAAEAARQPQEALQAVREDAKGLKIVVPREMQLEETRLALTPDAVALLVARGHNVVVEAGAGKHSKFEDHEYSNAGAQIAYSAEEAYKSGNLILKVNPPTLEEIGHIQSHSFVISALQTTQTSVEFINAMNAKRLVGIGFEVLEDEVGNMPIVRAMSEIAGSTVLLIASEYLSSANDGRGIILGGVTGVPPAKVLILGAGTVGEYAARTALGLGAEVKIFDNQLYKLRRIKQELGHQLFTSTLDLVNLTDAMRRADIVIGALRSDDGRAPCVVTDEMVAAMKPDSVIVDVSIDQGGCFETSRLTTHSNPVFRKYSVIHYCVPNIAARVAHTATTALSNILAPLLLQAHRMGGMEDMIFAKDWFMRGIYCYGGTLTNKHLARRLNLKHRDLNLLKVARM